MGIIHKIGAHWVMGMPVWVWLLVLGLGAVNEYINRTKKTAAQTNLQLAARFVLAIPGLGALLAKFPLLGWMLTRIATPPEAAEQGKLALPTTSAPGILLPFIFLPALFLLGSCGMAAAYKTLSGAEAVVKAAGEELVPFDKEKRKQIVRSVPSEEEGRKQLSVWDVTAEQLIKAVEGSHAGVILAKDGLKDVRAGLRRASEVDAWIMPALRAAMNIKSLLGSVGLKLKGL